MAIPSVPECSARCSSAATPSAGPIFTRSTCATREPYSQHRERFKVKFLAEANNVFNVKNVTTINTTAVTNPVGFITTAPTLAPTSTILEGRLIQLGIRADW